VCLVFVAAAPAVAQVQPDSGPQTREEVIAAERADKVAELWPERQNAMVDIANGLVERGLSEGFESGRGANGVQVVLGGMRSAQGMSGGMGYRRSDLFREHLGIRGTARATVRGAYMLDADVDFQGLSTDRAFLRWYTRFEHSPEIDYFGSGNDSVEANRTSYRYDDLSSDVSASFAVTRRFRIGATGGYFHARTAPSGEDDLPPINEAFPPETIRGLAEDTEYTRVGAFAYFDSRDSHTGPRSGMLLGARYREYWDVGRKEFAFRQTEYEVQKFLPYFNRGRVLAIRGSAVLSFPKEGNAVPLYLQPTLGGSDQLRGFVSYRFRDYHSVNLTAEHRWHAFSFLDMSLFVDAGKVVPLKRDLDTTNLHYSGGIGFRVRLRSAIVSRIDFASSSEGFRMIWTFSDVFDARF
jgi:outer membrane protein assembly factor BamA